MIHWKTHLKANVFVPCPICQSLRHEKICLSRTTRIPFLRTPISICKDCGFVYVNPRWTRTQYDAVMDLWYPYKWEWDPPTDPDESKRYVKWRKMDERISEFYPNGISSLLDVGAGQGWCIEYLLKKNPKLKACAVERWEPCQKHIEKSYGAKVIGSQIDGEWDLHFENNFELIVFRHTLEHILDPLPVLKRLRRFLSDTGYAYIVVPSMREIHTELIHDFFRPCHVSYFCKDTLESLCFQAGLEPFVLKESKQGEVWGLFKKGETKVLKPDVYQETKQIIRELRKKEWFFNWKFWFKMNRMTPAYLQKIKVF